MDSLTLRSSSSLGLIADLPLFLHRQFASRFFLLHGTLLQTCCTLLLYYLPKWTTPWRWFAYMGGSTQPYPYTILLLPCSLPTYQPQPAFSYLQTMGGTQPFSCIKTVVILTPTDHLGYALFPHPTLLPVHAFLWFYYYNATPCLGYLPPLPHTATLCTLLVTLYLQLPAILITCHTTASAIPFYPSHWLLPRWMTLQVNPSLHGPVCLYHGFYHGIPTTVPLPSRVTPDHAPLPLCLWIKQNVPLDVGHWLVYPYLNLGGLVGTLPFRPVPYLEKNRHYFPFVLPASALPCLPTCLWKRRGKREGRKERKVRDSITTCHSLVLCAVAIAGKSC